MHRTVEHHAYAETLPALAEAKASRMVGAMRLARWLAATLLGLLAAAILAMFFAPWQQSVTGKGRVVARSPLDRQQAIAAPIGGRIEDWYGHHEGSHVRKGESILKITDNDPAYLERLRQGVEQARLKLQSSKDKVQSYEFHIDELAEYRDFAVSSAGSVLEATEAKVQAVQQAVDVARVAVETAKLNLSRKQALFDRGYESARVVELAKLDLTKAETDFQKARAELDAANADVAAKRAQRDTYSSDADAKIAKAQAERNEAEGDIALAQKELLSAETSLARQATQDVIAPCDGVILRLQAAQAGDVVKAGDPLFQIVPKQWEQAVEIWVDGNDATLIESGRTVRLVFEGFPGIQFAGWPSIATGTFGGIVSLVDPTDNGQGMFRILVLPDTKGWPDSRFLRQGVRANAWVLLNRVALGYELWRKLNGFPPATRDNSPGDKEVKRPKTK